MKAITIPTSLYVALAQLEDKDAGQIAKAIARYVEEEKEPAFSNSLLKAFFTLFVNKSMLNVMLMSSVVLLILRMLNAK